LERSACRILLADSSPENLRAAGTLLRSDGYDLYLAESPQSLGEACATESFDLILISTSLSEADPIILLENLRAAAERELTAAFLVDRSDLAAASRAASVQGTEILYRPYIEREFLSRVRSILETADLRSALAARDAEARGLARRLEALLQTDPDSGLPDLRGLASRVRVELSRAARTGACFSILEIDLGGPETGGETGGDGGLRTAAAVLRTLLRGHDLLCRAGPREFAILLPDTDEDGAAALEQRCAEALARIRDQEIGLTSENRIRGSISFRRGTHRDVSSLPPGLAGLALPTGQPTHGRDI
jgi:diguanylate cyclase (GGDEF)-like protein